MAIFGSLHQILTQKSKPDTIKKIAIPFVHELDGWNGSPERIKMLDFSDKDIVVKPPQVANVVDALTDSGLINPDIPKKGEIYRHYKGGLYEITSNVEDEGVWEATMSPIVKYRPIDDHSTTLTFNRDLSVFMEKVPGLNVDRFAKVNIPTGHFYSVDKTKGIINEKIVVAIQQYYNMPHRYFHRFWHVEQMFSRATMPLSNEQILAILFKNIVFVAGAAPGANETASVGVFKQFNSKFNLTKNEHLVCELIMGASIEESKIIKDLHQVYLADPGIEFCSWEELIWMENRHLLSAENARKDFETRRLKYVISLVQNPVYQILTDYEESALANIEGLRQAWQTKYGKK